MTRNGDPLNEKPEEGKASSPRFGFLRKISSKKKKKSCGSKEGLSQAGHNRMNLSLPNSKHDPDPHDLDDGRNQSLEILDDVKSNQGDNAKATKHPDRKVLLSQDSITMEARCTPRPETMVHIDSEARPHNPVASGLFNTNQDAVDTTIDEVGYETPNDEEEAEEMMNEIAQRDLACFSDPTPAEKTISIPIPTPITPDQHQQKKEEGSPRQEVIGTNFSPSSASSSCAPSEGRSSAERNYTVRERHGAEWQKLHDMFEKNHGGSVPKVFDAPSSPNGYTKSKAAVGEIDAEHIKSVKELAKELNSRSPRKTEEATIIPEGIDMLRKVPLAPNLAQ